MTSIERAVKIYSKMKQNVPFEGMCNYADVPTIKQYMRRHGWRLTYKKEGTKAIYRVTPYDEE